MSPPATICTSMVSGGKMRKKRKRSGKAKSQKTLDPRVEDLRKKILHLDPYSGWFPAGATKRIMSIVDKDLEPIGELETGSDGFVQLAVLVGGRFWPVHRDSARLEQWRPRDPGGRALAERLGPRRGSRDPLVGLRQRRGFLDALQCDRRQAKPQRLRGRRPDGDRVQWSLDELPCRS